MQMNCKEMSLSRTIDVGTGSVTRRVQVYEIENLNPGIKKAAPFRKKGLADYGANIGRMCSHGCVYCFAGLANQRPAPNCRHINDPNAVCAAIAVDYEVAFIRDLAKLPKKKHVEIILSNLHDAWSPGMEGKGRKVLEIMLSQSKNTDVRILTKNAAVINEFDICAEYRDRVKIGLSLTGTADQDELIKIIEPNASKISERMDALRKANEKGLNTYAMLCPLLPGISSDLSRVHELVEFAKEIDAKEVFVEPLNDRGGTKRLIETLKEHGKEKEASAIESSLSDEGWSKYTADLLIIAKDAMITVFGSTDRLRFLLYENSLSSCDRKRVEKAHKGHEFIKWLNQEKPSKSSAVK